MASAIFAAAILVVSFWALTISAAPHTAAGTGGECATPADPKNGWVDIVYNAGVVQMAVYSCDPGYAIIGRNTMTCKDGQWDRKRYPTCIFVDCEAPEDISNGRVIYSSTVYNAEAEYKCDSCHKLEGVSTRVCKQSGVWSKESPKCVQQECENLRLTEGMFTRSRNPPVCGDSIKVQCRPGYTLQGADTALCLHGGLYLWWGQPPSCVRA